MGAGSKTHVLAAGRGPRRRSQAGGQPPGVADAGQPAVPAQPHEGSLPLPLGPCGWSRLGSSRACLSRGLDPGCGQCFSWPRRGLPLPAVGSLSIFAFETLLAQNFQPGGTCCNSAKRELEIIAKPLRRPLRVGFLSIFAIETSWWDVLQLS